MPNKMAKRVAKKTRKPKKDSGLFISRAMRREAEVQAQAEIEARQKEADDYADVQEKLAFDAKHVDWTPEQAAEANGKATTQALADARKKLKVDRTYKPS